MGSAGWSAAAQCAQFFLARIMHVWRTMNHFITPLPEVPIVWLDVETTGVTPGVDAVVQLAAHCTDGGAASWLVNPGRPIPPEATDVHGITDEAIADAPTLTDITPELAAFCDGHHPGAYNARFDAAFMPPGLFPYDTPWIDPLVLVRSADRYERGKGRHTLARACERRGIELENAHDALADVVACSRLWDALLDQLGQRTLGSYLCWQEHQRADKWFNFQEWLSRQ